MIKKISVLTVILVIVDQVVKFLVSTYLNYIDVIPKFLYLSLEKNYGVAFSMLWNNRLLILIISLLLILFLIYLLNKDYLSKGKNNKLLNVTYGLLFGGILGNLIDRIVRGFVIDYIDISPLIKYPVFNLADIFVVVGCLIVVISLVKDTVIKKKNIGE